MVKYHVGSNVPGYLPESDVACLDDIESAVAYFRAELKAQQDYYWEQCEGHCEECAEFERAEDCECDWCDVAGNVEADLSSITDTDVAYSVKFAGTYITVYRPQHGPDVVHWINAVAGCDCEGV